MSNLPLKTPRELAVLRALSALRLASASLPHLSGLARLVRLKASRRVEVAAVSSSGLILIHPDVFAEISAVDAAFVLAHELLHLALDTHGRQGHAPALLTNYAHDYIINDMLREEFDRNPPLGGLDMEGAREQSLEKLIADLAGLSTANWRCWQGGKRSRSLRTSVARTNLTRAMEDAGLVPPSPKLEVERLDPRLSAGDLIPDNREAEFEPEMTPGLRKVMRDEVRREAVRAGALSQIRQQIEGGADSPGAADLPQRGSALLQAIRDAYAVPWELALQRWFDATSPGDRTYARPTRRGQCSTLVRAGRRRLGHTLHIVLDTSGSMGDVLPKALGAIAVFCEASNVTEVHLVQCDEEVTGDQWVDPEELAEFRVTGYGLSDMSPGMLHLANDPEVESVLVLTDGAISYPAEPPAYRVLWALIGDYDSSFAPTYGDVVCMSESTSTFSRGKPLRLVIPKVPGVPPVA